MSGHFETDPIALAALSLSRPIVHCPYCKDGFREPRDAVACVKCGARHHLECFRELDRCATCGGYEAMTRREVRCQHRRKLTAFMQLFTLVTFTVSSGGLTYICTVDRNVHWPEMAHKNALEKLESDRSSLTYERGELERAKERFESQQKGWSAERDRVLRETALETENARHRAREGWRVAELVARAVPHEDHSLTLLREALASVPEGPSVLREALDERIALEESFRNRGPIR